MRSLEIILYYVILGDYFPNYLRIYNSILVKSCKLSMYSEYRVITLVLVEGSPSSMIWLESGAVVESQTADRSL